MDAFEKAPVYVDVEKAMMQLEGQFRYLFVDAEEAPHHQTAAELCEAVKARFGLDLGPWVGKLSEEFLATEEAE